MKFQADKRYRMPVFFGPMPGPRQIPEGKADPLNSPRRLILSVTHPTRAEHLAPLLPTGFSLWGAPRLILEVQSLLEIDWLAGRGYNTFGIKVPVRYQAAKREVFGHLLLVLWENQADPIITGREELGFAKLFCDISTIDPRQKNLSVRCSWFGFEFFHLDVCLDEDSASPSMEDDGTPPEGVMHYKYLPSTNVPGKSAVHEITLTPAENPNARLISRHSGQGRYGFKKGRWEDLPTLHHIVEYFTDADVAGESSVTLLETRGGKDLGDTSKLIDLNSASPFVPAQA